MSARPAPDQTEDVPAGPSRRTQADRSAATKAALADAAIEVLLERGWAAVTAVEVCSRVGVTRGAFHHHYANLPELMADALRRLYADVGRSGRNASPPTTVVELVERTWSAIGNPRFKAVIEAWLAMANDATLRTEIGPVVAMVSTRVRPDAVASILTDTARRDFFVTAREAMLGLALGRATNGGRPLGHERVVLGRLLAEAAILDGGA